MPGRARFILLLTAASWILPARAEDELSRVARPNASGGLHSDFTDDNPIGRFMDLLAEGAIADARSLQPQVCAAWASGRGNTAVAGRFYVNGTEISLYRLCEAEAPKPR